MKLIGVMSLKEKRAQVRDLFKQHDVRIYSETDILGHTTETIAKFGWFSTPEEVPDYSTLVFAIVEEASAAAVFDAIADLANADRSDHPIRAFLVPVERMV